jgi:hypothetical protein
MSQITQSQIAQKGNELNFYSQFRNRVPSNSCKTKVIGIGSSWAGFGSIPSVKSGVRSAVNINCISNSTKLILSNNIGASPAANNERFLGFGYPQGVQDGFIIV